MRIGDVGLTGFGAVWCEWSTLGERGLQRGGGFEEVSFGNQVQLTLYSQFKFDFPN